MMAATTAVIVAAGPAMASPPPPPVPPAPVELVNQFFDWTVTESAPPPPSFVQSPFLDDTNANSINSFLLGLPGSSIRAVKVLGPISTSTSNLIFNNPSYHVSYVFADIESAAAVTLTKNLVNQIRWVQSSPTIVSGGTSTKSARAYVSNFGMSDAPEVSGTGNVVDPTMPSTYFAQYGSTHAHSSVAFSNSDYLMAGVNMEGPDLYPGAPSYKNLAYGNSSAPNIRSGLFTLPAWRLGRVSDALIKNGLSTHRNVPWVTNFNNWNDAPGPGTLNDAPGTGGYQYYWTNPTATQMLSGRDFAALVAHYRLRGANSFHLMTSGVIGVNETTMQNQAREGFSGLNSTGGTDASAWGSTHLKDVLAASDKRLLIGNEPTGVSGGGDPYYSTSPTFNANTNIIEDGTMKNIEQAGAMFSGVYSLSQGKLDILLSNMDDSTHTLTLPSKIGGYALNIKQFTLAGDALHANLLLEYQGNSSKKTWTLSLSTTPFTDLDTDRSRAGVPEPGVLSLLAVAGFYGMTRRRRRTTGELEV